MTAGQLMDLLKGVDPNTRVFADVGSANKSVRGVQIVSDPKTKKPMVLLK